MKAKSWQINLPKNYTGILEWSDGMEFPNHFGIEYLKDEYFHRENGPASHYFIGHKDWFLNGQVHREDGPAIEWVDGRKQWFLNGSEYPEDHWKIEVEKHKKGRLLLK
jgi:hypothetical protein